MRGTIPWMFGQSGSSALPVKGRAALRRRAWLLLLLLVCANVWTARGATPNLLPNSSIECGTETTFTHGSCCAAEFGNDTAPAGLLSPTNTIHGNYSLRAPRTRFYYPVPYLLAGTYTETFWMMSDTAGTAIKTLLCATDFTSLLTNGCSNPNITVGTSGAWFTNQITILSNGYYSLFWYEQSPTPLVWIDAIQLQTGTVASAYAPMAPIEVGLTTTNLHHMLRPANPQYIQLKCWNDGSTAGMTSIVEVFDFANSNIQTTVVSTNALPSGATTINVSISHTGSLRATVYQPNVNNSRSELLFSVLPHAPTTVRGTNGVIGTHSSYGFDAKISAAEAGYTDDRSLSPAKCTRWSNQQPNGTGPFTFDPYCVPFFNSNYLETLFVLSPGLDNTWPAAATNAAGYPDTNAFAIYCGTNAAHFSPAPSNAMAFEIGNEWQGITNTFVGVTAFFQSASNTAAFQLAGARAVRANCAACTIVIGAGENDSIRGYSIWTNLVAMTNATGELTLLGCKWSAHLYPSNKGSDNPNSPDEDLGHVNSVQPWVQALGSVLPLWNTEMGNQSGKGGWLGPMMMTDDDTVGHGGAFATHGTLVPEAGRDWLGGQRKIVAVDRESKQVFRTLGCGLRKVFCYFGQETDSDYWSNDAFGAGCWEPNGALKGGSVAALIAARHFARYPGLGRVTNQTMLTLEAYLFTNQLGTVLATWCSSNTDWTMTFTNGHFGLWDVNANGMGTNLSSIRVGRTPVILVSGDMTRDQMVTNFMFATVTGPLTDTTGPSISMDISPIGVVTNGTYVFKWTVVDRNKQAWSIPASPATYSPDNTNNRSRIKFYQNDTWRDYGETNFAVVSLTVNTQMNLFVEGKDFYNNVTTNIGPRFGMMEPASVPPIDPSTNGLTINATVLNVGTLILQ